MKYKNHNIVKLNTTTTVNKKVKNIYRIEGEHGKRGSTRPWITSIKEAKEYINDKIELADMNYQLPNISVLNSKMQLLYRKMERLGMTPNKSKVSVEFVDQYNKDIEYGSGTIATMVKKADYMLNTLSEENWKRKGLKTKPDQVVFNVRDKKRNGYGNLIYNSSGYMGIQIFDSDYNEIG